MTASLLSSLPSARRRAGAAAGALLLVTSLASLAACNGGSSGGGGASSSAGSMARSDSAGGSAGEKAAAVPGSATGLDDSAKSPGATNGTPRTSNAARILPTDRDVVYRGSISVQVTDLGRAVDQAEALALGTDGLVGNEQTQTDPRHPRYGQATLTLRVPPSAFGPTLDSLGRLGKELGRQRSAEDVTSQVIDVDSRVRSQQRSVERMRTLLSQAKTIGEVVRVESELSQREADLESLEAQLKGLKDVTGLATIQVTLSTPDRTPPKPPKDDSNLGFLSGLGGGWDAFVGVTLVVLTVLGAVVPFGVAAALIGVPALLVWRSRRRLPAA